MTAASCFRDCHFELLLRRTSPHSLVWFSCRSHPHTLELAGLGVSWMFLCSGQGLKVHKPICSFCVCIVCCKSLSLSVFRILSSSFFLKILFPILCKVRLPKCLIIWLDLLLAKKYLMRENIPVRAYGRKDGLYCIGIRHFKPGYFRYYQAKSALCAGFWGQLRSSCHHSQFPNLVAFRACRQGLRAEEKAGKREMRHLQRDCCLIPFVDSA